MVELSFNAGSKEDAVATVVTVPVTGDLTGQLTPDSIYRVRRAGCWPHLQDPCGGGTGPRSRAKGNRDPLRDQSRARRLVAGSGISPGPRHLSEWLPLLASASPPQSLRGNSAQNTPRRSPARKPTASSFG
jgi:hypothetical protein